MKYWGSHGETHITNLSPCENGSGKYGWSAVWPANLDNYQIGGDGFVQLGYIEIASGWSWQGMTGRQFIYTPDDDSGGVFALADWVNPPVLGRLYEFKIKTVKINDTYFWDYCIQDKSIGGAEDCKRVSASWHGGSRSIWMFETANSKDVMGTLLGAADGNAEIYQMAYMTSDGTWFDWDQNTCNTGGPSNSAYHCADAGAYDIKAWTDH